MKKIIVVLGLLLCGCARLNQPAFYNGSNPIKTIRIELFQCNCQDSLTPLAVQSVISEVLLHNAEVEIVQSGDADVVIEGIMTTSDGAASNGGTTLFGEKSASSSGKFITGVVITAKRGNAVIAQSSLTQSMGAKMSPPEALAKKTASQIVKTLYRNGLMPKKRHLADLFS
jgi:hypothetical protein